MAWSKLSRQERGYGAEWTKTRLRILRRDNGLCQCRHCKEEDRVTVAHEVDHVVSKAKAAKLGWAEDRIEADANLQAINRDCHKRKTMEDEGCTEKVRIGLDGFPV
jgi:5-methylcytosine-specific restriction protein A